MERTHCIVCGGLDERFMFAGYSRRGEEFRLVRCARCGFRYLNPRPDPSEMESYYGEEYFSRRTDRGYDGYFTDAVRSEIERVMALNLRDLDFEAFEASLGGAGTALDIGCAAGYFVEYLAKRGWHAGGIDVSGHCVDYARSRGLAVERNDYLKHHGGPYDLVTLWASIEHLHRPDLFIEKIARELRPGGMLYVSTCRAGGFGFERIADRDWRFYNFPEHLCFFSRGTLKRLLERNGFSMGRFITYGSGFGAPGSAVRKIADMAAKRFRMGDMMLVSARKS